MSPILEAARAREAHAPGGAAPAALPLQAGNVVALPVRPDMIKAAADVVAMNSRPGRAAALRRLVETYRAPRAAAGWPPALLDAAVLYYRCRVTATAADVLRASPWAR
ncbi:hypothetical protein ACQVP2_28240 [Methylobacterium aquaticum]|uniref:hypothetical protein n=1 Tax=Methylobacterium aquaticum TaxID=270351 RepID=UPI003D16B197